MQSNRITLVKREQYTIDLEFNESLAILHLPFAETITKALYEDSREVLRSIKTLLLTIGYDNVWAAISEGDIKMKRLVNLYGFELKGSAQGFEVYTLES